MQNITVLVVDDEAAIRDMLNLALVQAGFNVLVAADAQEALTHVVDHRPDLLLLDWMLPGMSGIELTRRLKSDVNTRELPIIMLTARGDEENKINGLEAGADDYVTKPFSTRELVSRARAVLRRTHATFAEESINIDGLCLDTAGQRISAHGQLLELGPTEFRLLAFFMTHPERAYSRDQLLDQVWGANVYVEDRTVDVHIRRLRKALSAFGFEKYIQTVRGTGYRFSSQLPQKEQ